MGTSLYVSDTSGIPIDNASLSCGTGCQSSNEGGGFYWASVNLDPASGAIVVAAPGKMPTVYTWWNQTLTHGRVALEDIPDAEGSKW